MTSGSSKSIEDSFSIPPDDPLRNLILTEADDRNLTHIGLVGDTYTILLGGKDTAGRFCPIDMYVPSGGGPPPHRHDFEESFLILEGEIEATFRGKKSIARAGETVHIPANAPHQFQNKGDKPVRLLCICSPAGQEEFFPGGWGAGCHSHNASTETRSEGSTGIQSEGGKTRAEV
jgi:quercetin dioxygenase-like cupin family protein